MRYFRRHWDESRGDEYDAWGPATYYFEADDELHASRQMEIYSAGPVLKYHQAHLTDGFGFLTDQPLDLDEMAPYEIGRDEFEAAWESAVAANLPNQSF